MTDGPTDLPPTLDAELLRRQLDGDRPPARDTGELAEVWRRREAAAQRAAHERREWLDRPAPTAPTVDLPSVAASPAADDAALRRDLGAVFEVPDFGSQPAWRRRLSRWIAKVFLGLGRFLFVPLQRTQIAMLDRHGETRRALATLADSVDGVATAVARLGDRIEALEQQAWTDQGETLDQRMALAEIRADQALFESAVERLRGDLAAVSED